MCLTWCWQLTFRIAESPLALLELAIGVGLGGADELLLVVDVGGAELVGHVGVHEGIDAVLGLLGAIVVGLVTPYGMIWCLSLSYYL